MMKKLALLLLLLTGPLLLAKTPSRQKQQLRLEKVLHTWQSRLGMDSVVIDEFLVVGRDGVPPGAVGAADFKNDRIVIHILEAQGYPAIADKRKIPTDQNNSVLHELLHVAFSLRSRRVSTEDGDVYLVLDHENNEFLVRHIADAVVRVKP